MKGWQQAKEGRLFLRQLRPGLCVCVIQRVNGQDKSAFERYQAHWFLPRTATLLGFSPSTVSLVYQEWSTTQRTANLTQLWEALGVNMGQYICGTLLTP
jgi:hypothetical protein